MTKSTGQRIRGRVCGFGDCNRPHSVHGYCKTHSEQMGTTRGLRPIGSSVWAGIECMYPHCDRPAVQRRLCTSHRSMLSRYKITDEMLDTMVANWRCQICGTEKMIHVDHDHQTGAYRGLLCMPCNTAIGKLGDTIEGVKRALAYLEGVR